MLRVLLLDVWMFCLSVIIFLYVRFSAARFTASGGSVDLLVLVADEAHMLKDVAGRRRGAGDGAHRASGADGP